MSDAPERIWAWRSSYLHTEGHWSISDLGYDEVKYVRADLYEALQARVAELEAERAECDEYLKLDETPRQRMDRDQADVLSLMKLLKCEKYKLEAAYDDALDDAARVADEWYRNSGHGTPGDEIRALKPRPQPKPETF